MARRDAQTTPGGRAAGVTQGRGKAKEAFDRALASHQAGRLDEAERGYAAILRQWPDHADTLNLLGVVLCQTGRSEAGVDSIRKAVRLREAPQYLLNLALAHQGLAQTDAAIDAQRRAVALDPRAFAPQIQLAQMLQNAGQYEAAVAAYFAALALKPDEVETYLNVGGAFEELKRTAEAAAAYRILLDSKPDDIEARFRLATLLHDMGREDEARTHYKHALTLEPKSLELQWRLASSHLRLNYTDEAQMQAARTAYDKALRAFAARVAGASAEDVRPLVRSIGRSQPFYLAYHGRNDVNLQKIFGATVCHIMRLTHPDFVQHVPVPPRDPQGRLRIGIASAYLSRHSNWKIPIKGWAQNLDRSRFELYAYHLGARSDDETAVARKSFDHFVEGRKTIAEWAARIRDDRLHVLVYPETGMDPDTLNLAALRLAPVQAVSWGHPNTSGLPTIDYFLSSELMEEVDADAHYSETLVRLPNLSIHYIAPRTPHVDMSRKQLGLGEDAVVYWCCQAAFKYLPRHDEVFARIAKRVPKAQFVFISYARGSRVTERMQERLLQAFLKHGLSAQRHCMFVPQMDLLKFNAMARASDVFLDTIEWSGCNSLLEALMFDLPPVTMQSRFMRGRHASAILTMMGVEDLVARDLDDYVERAVTLGLDAGLRAEVRQRVSANKGRLLGDLTCIRGLEDFFERAVERAGQRSLE